MKKNERRAGNENRRILRRLGMGSQKGFFLKSVSSPPLHLLFLTHSFVRHKDDFYSYFLRVLTEELVRQGHKVALLAPHARDPEAGLSMETHEWLDGVEIHRFRFAPAFVEAKMVYRGTFGQLSFANIWQLPFYLSFFVCFLWKAVGICRRAKPDVITAHWWIPGGVIGAVLATWLKIGLVVSLHGRDLHHLLKWNWMKKLAGWVFSKAEKVTVVSSYLAQLLTERLPEVGPKLAVASMPVASWYAQPRPLPMSTHKLILTAAVFTQQKCLDDLIDAFQILHSRVVPFAGLLIGAGPLEKHLKSRVVQLGLSEIVQFKPFMAPEAFSKYYEQARVCVLPSEKEGYGLFLAEAQLCGRPVIGADSGGILDIIEHNVSGLLVPLHNPPALADAIQKVLEDDRLVERLAREGLRRAKEKHDTPKATARYAELCRQAAAEAGGR